MTELKLDSRSIDPAQLKAYKAIVRVASEKQVPFIVVGASARDLVMHHGYGAPIQRATRDIDIAVQVPDWESFESLCESLVSEGYKKSGIPHRLHDSQNVPLDIIPFGPLEDTDHKISWPPDGEIEMGVMGFKEALDHAIQVFVDGNPELQLPVVSPQGLALLKLIAWFERDAQARRKDANDLAYLAATYENIPGLVEQLYERHEIILEAYDWDTRLSGAHVFGHNVARIADPVTLRFLESSLTHDKLADLAKDGGSSVDDGNIGVLSAFRVGLLTPESS